MRGMDHKESAQKTILMLLVFIIISFVNMVVLTKHLRKRLELDLDLGQNKTESLIKMALIKKK